MTRPLCIYHAQCQDGFASAWAVHRRFGAEVDLVAAKYGDAPQLSAPCRYHSTTEPCTDCLGTGYDLGGGPFLDRDVLIVDFSYPLDVLRAIAKEARSVLVLDHHKTAQEDLKDLPLPASDYGWESWIEYGPIHGLDVLDTPEGTTVPRFAAIFDMDRSGAGITWDYLHPDAPRPRLIDLVEDRDLWRFAHDPETRRFHAVAASYGYELENFERWDEWDSLDPKHPSDATTDGDTWEDVLRQGAAILRAQAHLVDGILTATRRTMRIAGHVVPIANVPGALASEAGNWLVDQFIHEVGDPDDPTIFSATYYDGADGRRHFSLRSPPGGADVGAIAKQMAARFDSAGGGHEHASGFDAPLGWEGE